MRIVYIKGEGEIKKPKASSREKMEAFEREFIRKHNLKFKSKDNGTY